MERYVVPEVSCAVGPNPLICDANLLVALFSSARQELREEAEYVVETNDYQLITPISAVVEAFHFCKQKDALPLLEWVTDFSQVGLLPEDTMLVEAARAWHARTRELDLVDCLLIVYSRHLANVLGRTRPLPIVTSDQRMINIARGFDHSLTFLDLNEPLNGVQ